MNQQQDLDRNLPATPYKLQKARERGQVPRSPDLVAAGVIAVAVLYLSWQGWAVWREQFRLDQAVLVQAAQLGANPAALWPLVQRLIRSTLVLGIPVLGSLVLVGIAFNVLQTGPVFSIHPIKPDWNRLDPVAGFKRVFSMRTLFLALRALLKLGLLSLVVWFAIKNLFPGFFSLATLSPLGLMHTLLADLASLGLKIALMLGLIAILDLMYTRHEFSKNMRMNHREVREEIKQREGDPRIHARLRQLRRELLKRSLALLKTRKADVMITNPTHLAVALRYVHGEMEAPEMLAKGRGFMAMAMRRIAARYRIPVVQNPSLARALYRDLPVNQQVPPDLYAPVARIIVWVLARREAMQRMTAAAVPGRSR